jgi:predicted  nucleic acid-binding Zn-ribbon protein
MTRLRFHEILLLSAKEKTARREKFKSLVTVIKGENDCGKSCLIKSLYTAFGATPKRIHPNWNKLDVSLLVYFEIGGAFYRILKSGRQYTVFNVENDVVGSFGSITKGLGPFFAELFNFRLELTNSTTMEPWQATPAFLFLPFYADQDASWVDNWDSFESLKQYKSYRPAIAQFHTGIKPNEYYVAKNRKTLAENELVQVRQERAVIHRVLERIEQIAGTQFDMSIQNYEREIELLLQQCNKLQQAELVLRDELIALENRRYSIERQIGITELAASELRKDFDFASEKLDDEIECPTCGAEYHNSFAERFGIAQDEDQMRALLVQLHDELDACIADMAKRKANIEAASEQVAKINAILEMKQGEVKLQDILRSEGKKEVRTVLRSELNVLNQRIGEIDDEVESADDEMKSASSKKRSKEIKEYYMGRMTAFLQQLQVKELSEASYKEVHSKIKENGSDLPRALLAFYFAIIKTIEKYSTTTRCPLVIDSPKQQDQDPENWKRMLEFMRDQRPPESQMIVGLVDDMGISLGGDVIELKDERQLLQSSQYNDVAEEMRMYIDKALAY